MLNASCQNRRKNPNVAENQESVKMMRDKMIGKTNMILSSIILFFQGF